MRGIIPLYILFSLTCSVSFAATIGIVRDGPGSWYFEDQVSDFKSELADIAGDEYTVTYKEFGGAWDGEEARQAVAAAIGDPDVDIVYTAGMAVSMIARALPDEARTKPVFGGAVQYSNVHDYPISREGTSTVKNFAFMANPQRVVADLELLLRLSSAKTVDIMIDGLFFQHLTDLDEITKIFEDTLGVTIRFVAGAETPASYVEHIPADAEAIYVSVLGRLDESKRTELYDALKARKLINVSMAGANEMDLGAMAGLASDARKPISRRIALNLHQLIKGGNTADLPVYIPVEDRLTINMPSAKAIGWSPDYDTALEALFIGQGALEDGETLTLVEAMDLAALENVELLIANEGLRRQQAVQRKAKSNLYPNLSLTGEYGRTEIGSPVNPEGANELHGGSYGVKLSQILFNDAVRVGSKAAKLNTAAQAFVVESARLDAMEAAGVNFLQLLLNQDLYRIQQENLRLTDNNLRLARLRQSIGAADPSEVFRWESSAAQARATLFQQDGAVRDALAAFNQVLGAPQDMVWKPEDIELDDAAFYFLDDEMEGKVNTYREFQIYRDFIRARAVENAPELKRFDASLEAQGYVVKQARRKRFLPEFAGSASWTQNPQGSNLSDDASQDELFFGVVANIPLFEGGGIKAEADEQRARFLELKNQRLQAEQFIEQQAVGVWNGIGSLHPSIRLSRQARDAARKTYFAVRDKYSQGAATILDILDAQVQLLQQEQQTSQALYSYLINVVRMQRTISWFEHEQSAEDRQAWVDTLSEFLKQKDTP